MRARVSRAPPATPPPRRRTTPPPRSHPPRSLPPRSRPPRSRPPRSHPPPTFPCPARLAPHLAPGCCRPTLRQACTEPAWWITPGGRAMQLPRYFSARLPLAPARRPRQRPTRPPAAHPCQRRPRLPPARQRRALMSSRRQMWCTSQPATLTWQPRCASWQRPIRSSMWLTRSEVGRCLASCQLLPVPG